MNILEETKSQYESCKRYIKFYKRVLINYDFFIDIISKKEIKEPLKYYKEYLKWLQDFIKELEEHEKRNN